MPIYSIQAPNGQTYEIEGPDGATQEQVQQEVLRQFPEASGEPNYLPVTVTDTGEDITNPAADPDIAAQAAAEEESAPQDERGFWDNLNRHLVSVRRGLAGIDDIFLGLGPAASNALLGTDFSTTPSGDRIDQEVEQARAAGHDYSPRGEGEQLTDKALQGVGAALPLAVTGVLPALPELLAGGAAGLAGEYARQNDVGPVGQLAASVAGGVAAPASLAGVAKTSGAFGKRAPNELMQAFERQQVPALPADVGGAGAKMGSGFANMTLGGIPLAQAAEKSVQAARTARNRIAESIGRPARDLEGRTDIVAAGQTAQKGARQFLEKSESKANALYSAIPIDPKAKAQLSSTRSALSELGEGFTSNPELSRLWAENPRLQATLEALTPTDTRPAGHNRIIFEAERLRGATSDLENAQASLRAIVDDVSPASPQKARQGAAARQEVERAQGAFDNAKQAYDEAYIEANQPPMGGELSWQDLNHFRSIVGRIVGQPSLTSDGAQIDQLRKLYGALSEDMRATAQAQGPGALKAFERANTYFRARQDRIENVVSDILGKDLNASGEDAFRAIERAAAANGDAVKLARTLRTLPDDEANAVRATIFDRLGTVSKGRQDETGLVFSPSDFVTHWNGLSSRAKSALFPGEKYRKDIDDLVRIAASQKGAQSYANVSRTGNAVNGIALLSGFFTNPLGTLPIALGQIGFGGVMANQKFARWLASVPAKPNPAAQLAHINQLSKIAASQPVIANDVLRLQERLAQAFTESPAPLAAEDKQDRGPIPPE